MARTTKRTIITTPELLEQVNPVNKKIAEKFLKNYRTKSSPISAQSYESDYNIFFCWNVLYNDNKAIVDIKKSELIEFFNFAVEDLG